MNGGALAVLVVMAVPLVWIVVLLISDARHNRRVRAEPERTVAGIRERLEREQAEADGPARRARSRCGQLKPADLLKRLQLVDTQQKED